MPFSRVASSVVGDYSSFSRRVRRSSNSFRRDRAMSNEAPSDDAPRRRRRGGERIFAPVAAAPQPRLRFAPVDIVSRDELESIHQAALTVLREIGIDILHDEAKTILGNAGADVDPRSNRVRFDPALVESQIGLAPKSFTLHARNPERNVIVGDGYVAFCSVASTPNAFDRDGGRRPGNHRDYQNFLRLGQTFDSIHVWGGYPVEPADLHPSIRHLDALFDMLTLSDKPIHAYSLGRERIRDGIEMARLARGIDQETLEREPSLFTIINSSSPLRLDTPMLEGVIQMARRNQIVVLTPFTLAGAMAPVTLAGALAQQHAEALAGLVVAQLARPGSPFVYGGFTSNVDMKSGAPAFGTPEYMKTAIVGGQLARRLGLPYRSSNANAANSLDAQAAYESVFSLWGAIMGGVNFLMHGAGWMEGGLQASFEKMALDADLLAMVADFLRPLRVDPEELALEAMREVGPGGHFFGAAHTQTRYRNAFFAPMISDWRNYETWREAGAPTAYDTAQRIYKERLRNYSPPPIEADRREALETFVARRRAEGGAPTDF
jgi:trimethylamine---corrinoid protein Co-methyltransferase